MSRPIPHHEGFCESCRHWAHPLLEMGAEDTELGYCWRYPPVPVAVGMRLETAVPRTMPIDSCGEYLARHPLEEPRVEPMGGYRPSSVSSNRPDRHSHGTGGKRAMSVEEVLALGRQLKGSKR
ncbi:MAG: hypothetical protein ACK5SX_15165 [Sandaracinobacter sp.]